MVKARCRFRARAVVVGSPASGWCAMESRSLFAISFGVGLGIVLVACGTKQDSGQTASESEAAAESTSGDAESGESGPGMSSAGPGTAEASSDESSTGETNAMSTTAGFIQDPDGGSTSVECDVWAQDCPEDEKCMPWGNDGGTWNATRCSPLNPNAGEPGDACTVEGNAASGIDDCALGSMCWDVDETNTGVCVSFCMGTEANPVCEDPNASCTIANEGTVILCLPSCDPLLQDCQDGNACYPVDDAFVCGPDESGEMGLFGDPCEFINVCDAGLFCAPADVVPDCTATQRCCTSFCDLGEPDPGASCPGAAGGQDCVPWFDEGQAPPGFDDVGACAIPA